MMSRPNDSKQPTSIEGEGNITADRRYRAAVEQTVKEGHVDELARDAREALDGPEGEQLRAAEKIGKGAGRHSKLSAEELARAEGEGMTAPPNKKN